MKSLMTNVSAALLAPADPPVAVAPPVIVAVAPPVAVAVAPLVVAQPPPAVDDDPELPQPTSSRTPSAPVAASIRLLTLIVVVI